MASYLIIGASSGIGRQLALTLADAGHTISGTYHRHPMPSDHPGITLHPFDASVSGGDLSFLPETIDGLAYCPGTIALKPFHRLAPERFAEDYALNVLGAVRTIQAALPALRKSGAASIVLFSTVAVQTGLNFHSLVSASKGAVEGLTRALAAELAPSIRVNAIAPSLTDTPLAGSLLGTPEKREAGAQRHPLRRIGQPADIAQLAAFLLGPQSGWISGQIIAADGGLSTLRI